VNDCAIDEIKEFLKAGLPQRLADFAEVFGNGEL
jgi:hypothetical protein